MAELDKHSGHITIEEVFFRAMLNISQISGMIYTSTSTEWQRNALNLEQALNNLESLASPFLPKDYNEKMMDEKKKLYKEYLRRKLSLSRQQMIKTGHDLEVKYTCSIANMRLSVIQECLYKEGIIFNKSLQIRDGLDDRSAAVTDDEPEEELVDAGSVPGI